MALSESDRKRWDELHELWNSKMKEQQEVAKKLSKCLDADDGLVDNSKKVIKNLDAAIVASKQPGYFKYYQPSDNVKKLEERKEVDRLQKRMKNLQSEMDQARKEIETMETRRRERQSDVPKISSLSHWFNTYGRPKEVVPGAVTSFTPTKKVYGGTRHHPAFKSLAKTMKVGRRM
jgi:ribosomal protein S24E